MFTLLPLVLFLSLFQAGDPSAVTGEIFSPSEKARLENETNLDRRIKVYEAASKRMQKALEAAVSKEEFQTVPDMLKVWISLLSKSLEDIEANLKTKKKSRALISYEIQVRKSIANTQNYKIRAPVEQQDVFDSSLVKAETVRKRFVEILFRH